MTANIILTAVAVLSLFLAVVAIRASKKAHDKLQTWEHCLEMRSANTGQHFEKVHSEISSLRNALFAANGELATLRQNFDLTMEQKANQQQDTWRLLRKLEALAQHHGLYWNDEGRWSDNPFGGNGLVNAACGASNQLGAQVQAQRGANRAKRRT